MRPLIHKRIFIVTLRLLKRSRDVRNCHMLADLIYTTYFDTHKRPPSLLRSSTLVRGPSITMVFLLVCFFQHDLFFFRVISSMKSMPPPLAAIIFMTFFYWAGGHGLLDPPGSATEVRRQNFRLGSKTRTYHKCSSIQEFSEPEKGVCTSNSF